MKYLLLSALCLAAMFVVENASAQSTAGPEVPQSGVVLTELFTPVYTPLARQAGIFGDVRVQLGIRQDGSVESATLVSGHPILAPAAMDSARQSKFECNGCSVAIASYELIYTFEFSGHECWAQSRANVTQSQNRITISDIQPSLCDPSSEAIKKRKAKCLYLWKCGW
jgi:hypothetical protein